LTVLSKLGVKLQPHKLQHLDGFVSIGPDFAGSLTDFDGASRFGCGNQSVGFRLTLFERIWILRTAHRFADAALRQCRH